MSPLLTVALLGVLLAAPEASTPPPPNAELQVWVIEASNEGREKPYFDKEIDALREAVQDKENDTYKLVKIAKHSFRTGKTMHAALSDRYTLDTTLPDKSPDGRYRFALRVTMPADEKTGTPLSNNPLLQPNALLPPQKNTGKSREIEALSSKLSMQPEEKVVVRGLKTDAGKDMVIVLSLTAPRETRSR